MIEEKDFIDTNIRLIILEDGISSAVQTIISDDNKEFWIMWLWWLLKKMHVILE